jgi:CRP/FNR family cyclic AMP-dependent transcriptional regulator
VHTTSSADGSQRGKLSFLRGVPLFADLGEADLAALAADFSVRKYDKGESVFHQGDESRDLYVISSGKVRVFTTSPGGGETSIVIFSVGAVIGELSAIDGKPRSATTKAISPAVLLLLSREQLLRHLTHNPTLAMSLLQLLAAKSRWTTEYAEAIAQYDSAGRLLYILLHYNKEMGEAREPGRVYELDLGLSQVDLATLVGARREWVNRILQDWRKRGLLEYQAGKILILDLPRVQAELYTRTEAAQSSEAE